MTSNHNMGAKDRRRRQRRLFAEQSGICAICGLPLPRLGSRHPRHPDRASLDHIIPRSRGGKNDLSNLQLVHDRCNNEKADQVPPSATN